MSWYIVEYEKGGYDRAARDERFKTKHQAEVKIKQLFEEDPSHLYRVFNTSGCPDGDCSVCQNTKCTMHDSAYAI